MRYADWVNGEIVPSHLSPRGAMSLLRISLSELAKNYSHTGWETLSPEDAAKNLIDEDTIFVFVDYKIVAVSMSQPWFSAEAVITEEFVDEGVPLHVVNAILEFVARTVGVKRILVGTRAAPNQRHAGLAKLYSREGLTVSTVELMRVIDYEQEGLQERPQDAEQV